MIQAIGYSSYPLQMPQIGIPTGDLNSKLATIYSDLAPDERSIFDTKNEMNYYLIEINLIYLQNMGMIFVM